MSLISNKNNHLSLVNLLENFRKVCYITKNFESKETKTLRVPIAPIKLSVF